MRESFIFYSSFHEAFKDLTDEQYGQIMRIINEYAFNNITPDLSDPYIKTALSDPYIKTAFTLIKAQTNTEDGDFNE